MTDTKTLTRTRSSAVFGNEKFVEVVMDLADRGADTAQGIATRTHLAHSLVRSVLVRLADSGLVEKLPRATKRGALYYEPILGQPGWDSLVKLCVALAGDEFDPVSGVERNAEV